MATPVRQESPLSAAEPPDDLAATPRPEVAPASRPAGRAANTVLGAGRPGKVWAEDAKANIAYFEAKLAMITVRHGEQHRRFREAAGAMAASVPPAAGEPGARCVVDGRQLSPAEVTAMCDEVTGFLEKAERAAYGDEPGYRRFRSWWSGTSTEAAFKNLHYAEASIARLYGPAEIRAELPDAVRRATDALAVEDPTRLSGLRALATVSDAGTLCYSPEELSVLIGLGHEAADRQRARLRGFRNVTLVAGLLLTVLVGLLGLLCWLAPSAVPLCFTPDPHPPATERVIVCPTGEAPADPGRHPDPFDVPLIACFGLVGGAISSAVFIRSLQANSTPYNVAVPLALLKLPTGALAAVVGMVLVAGDFVPGFSAIDMQTQILAYSLLFGFAQQLLTGMLDRRAKALIANVPTKAKEGEGTGRAEAR